MGNPATAANTLITSEWTEWAVRTSPRTKPMAPRPRGAPVGALRVGTTLGTRCAGKPGRQSRSSTLLGASDVNPCWERRTVLPLRCHARRAHSQPHGVRDEHLGRQRVGVVLVAMRGGVHRTDGSDGQRCLLTPRWLRRPR
jgi:hypothetical protein